MAILLAVAITAIVTGALAAFFVDRAVRTSLNRAIGGRQGSDPLDEHRRMLARAEEHADAAAARSEVLRLALDALTSGVIVTDHAGQVLVRNRLAVDASARSHEQTLVEATAAELLSTAVQGAPAEREVEIFGPPARTLFVHAVPITAAAQVVGALAVIDDVTDSHRIDKTRRDFVANLSHELRTPVGAVSLLAELLADERDEATRSQLTERLFAEAERMTNTIDDLLELSRIESDVQRYDERIVVQQLIEEVMARTSTAADAAGVVVASTSPADAIVLEGNRDQLLSAMVNLVDNAVKYSERGDSVSIRARVAEGRLFLVVQDTGRGIPARDQDRIFERFYRVDRSRDSATGGTGIGLSIVRHVALNHGGAVSVSSFEGEGSTFTIELPMTSPGLDSGSEHMQPSGEVS